MPKFQLHCTFQNEVDETWPNVNIEYCLESCDGCEF